MSDLAGFIQDSMKKALGSSAEIGKIESIGGGCINSASKVEIKGEPFFVKWNETGSFPRMLEIEAKGLQQLAASGVTVPSVVGQYSNQFHQILILDYLDGDRRSPDFSEKLGRMVAQLHSVSSSTCGLHYNNYIGSIDQPNEPMEDWGSFFVERRMKPLMMELRDHLSEKILSDLDELCELILLHLPRVEPKLLHGDLWNGNIIGHQNAPFLIDPAIYFGHPEVDLAMTKLFGGFENDFYRAYEEVIFLEEGWQKRLNVWNLYPVLVHLRLFGSGYLTQLKTQISTSFRCFYTYYI